MPEENVAAIQRVYERWGRGDFRASVELFDPQVLFVIREGFPDPGTYLGIAEIGSYMRGFLEPWTEISIGAEKIVGIGDSVLVDVHQRGVGSASGLPTEFRYFQLWTFRGRKVIRLENCRRRSEALEAAGAAG